VATAALCVSAVLLWLALPGRLPLPAECSEPGERSSRDGWTLEATCATEPGELPPVRGPARRLFGLPLDPNRASPATLETLPGIGPSRAAAIAAARSSAPFCEFDDLDRVPGIGPRTLEKLSGLLEIEPFSCTGR
jgi:competence protein ComEA